MSSPVAELLSAPTATRFPSEEIATELPNCWLHTWLLNPSLTVSTYPTVGSGVVGRAFQVILRLYESKSAILNGFDIDCCCCGFDGTDALITQRCVAAMSTKVNLVNLQIRGECYECRLLKYVERGFSIGVPLLDNSKRDREHLAFKIEKSASGLTATSSMATAGRSGASPRGSSAC